MPLITTTRGPRTPDPGNHTSAKPWYVPKWEGEHGLGAGNLVTCVVTFGLVWLVVLLVQVMQRGLVPANKRRLMCLSMFWHFLDVVWIGVFSFVYLISTLP